MRSALDESMSDQFSSMTSLTPARGVLTTLERART